jgi:hypothetical protein
MYNIEHVGDKHMSVCALTYGPPWSIVLSLFAIYMTWQHFVLVASIIFTSSTLTQKLTMKAGLKAFQFWRFIRSFALVRVTRRLTPSLFEQPVLRFLVGHGGGGRVCGSLLVYSPPTVDSPIVINKPAPFDD